VWETFKKSEYSALSDCHGNYKSCFFLNSPFFVVSTQRRYRGDRMSRLVDINLCGNMLLSLFVSNTGFPQAKYCNHCLNVVPAGFPLAKA
jgi:hypothetical protein